MTPAHGLLVAEATAAVPAASPQPGGDTLSVETRLGPVDVRRDAIIDMPQGPLGFARHTRFALAALPNPDHARFRLLQSMDDPSVSFVVAPVEPDGGPIDREDIDQACLAAGIAPGHLVVLLIVTVRNDPTGVSLTANLRAPVIVDARKRIGRQVVLANPSYDVRHPL